MSDEQTDQPAEIQIESEGERMDKVAKAYVEGTSGKKKAKAIAGLRQFKKDYKGMFDISFLADFGHYIKAKGTDAVSIGLTVYAAAETKEAIDANNEAMEETDNPEIKVRLQEAKVKLLEGMGKHARDLAKVEEPTKGESDKKPALPPFPANVNVAIQNVVSSGESPVES